jgi:hypothetical protein
MVSLQEALNRAYEDGNYGRMIDYTVEAVPPLHDEDASWADRLLRDKGLR